MNSSNSERIRTFCRLKPRQVQLGLPFESATKYEKQFQIEGPLKYDVLSGKQSGGSANVLRIYQPFLLASPLYNGNSDFGFDHVFGEDSAQEDLFDEVVRPVLEGFLSGLNSCICCYGQTGTGKTWTMSGGETYVSRGLIQRTIEALYAASSGAPISLLISYMEIYNEVAYDLLGASEVSSDIEAFPRVTLQDDESGTLHMRNLSLHAVSSVDEAVDLFMFGNVNRVVSSTVMNEASSRSHCIFTIHLENQSHILVRTSRLHLVDLAGSERVWKSSLRTQSDLSEAKHINKSLHFLEQVMQSLFKKRSHIPYRNSVLTSVLRDALGGNCNTVLVGNISTDACNYKETIATCRFLQRCGQIEVAAARVNNWSRPILISEKKHRDDEIMIVSKMALKPVGNENKFVFEGFLENSESVSLRDLQEACGSNLSLFPKELRKQLIEKIRSEGMDFKVSCVGDLCALVQVLMAKLTQSDTEKKELRDRLKSVISEPIPHLVAHGAASCSSVLTINLSETQQWKRSDPADTD